MYKKTLREYFPQLLTREEICEKINSNQELQKQFAAWNKRQQEQFLDMCSGEKGLKVLYDFFCKEVLNPEYDPERLESMLGVILQEPVRIVKVLPNDTVRIADEGALVVTDIIVELEDGSIANVEVQKIGYLFTGSRCSCYLSDMMLRQYKRVRRQRGKHFSYKDIKKIYLIVLYEKSPAEFKKMPTKYLHHSRHVFDTGLEIDLLQRCVLIPLDIFRRNMEGRPISNLLEAWLTFFCEEDPKRLGELFESYPMFREMYGTLYGMCQNVGKIMGFFSEELRILDRNTAQYMIDIQQEQLDSQREQLDSQREQLDSQREQLEQQRLQLAAMNRQVKDEAEEIARKLFENGATLQLVTAAMNGTLTEKEICSIYENFEHPGENCRNESKTPLQAPGDPAKAPGNPDGWDRHL